MNNDGLEVAGVTSDGCPFQKAALIWTNPLSIQQNFEVYSE
jgi:hypothetical protein